MTEHIDVGCRDAEVALTGSHRDSGVDWIEAARALRSVLASSAAQADHERRLPDTVHQALVDAGLFGLKLPRAYGGAEANHATVYRVVEEVSRSDASAGWLLGIGSEVAACAGYLPRSGAEVIFRNGPASLGAGAVVAQPGAAATPVEGGFRLSGHWALASGAARAHWLAGAAPIIEADGPRRGPDGAPDVHFFFFPRHDCKVLETWQALGLRASESHDFVVDDVFIPDDRHFSVLHAQSTIDGPLWCGRYPSHLGLVGAVSLGVARAAIDELTALAATRVPTFTRTRAAERADVQTRLGRAEALTRAASRLLYAALDDIWSSAQAGQPPSPHQAAMLRLAVVHATQSSAEAVELMYTAAGTAGVYEESPLERNLRDIHVLTQHMAGSTMRYEQAGRFFLGLEPGPR
jgi:alkylation response protein AidB-like acyl-CoA dehydrogenase